MLRTVGLDCLLTLVACLLLVGALPLEALTALLGADLVACLFLDTVALLLDAVVFLLDLGALFLAPEPLVFLLRLLLLLALLLLVPAPFDLCLLRDLRPLLPLAIVFFANTFVIPFNNRALTG